MRLIVAVLALVLCLQATSYVLVIQPDRIYIGADSKRADYSTGKGISVCKVKLWKDKVVLTYGLAGHLANGSIEAHLFINDIEAVAGTNTSITEARNVLARRSEAFLQKEIDAFDTYERRGAPITAALLQRYKLGAVLLRMTAKGPEVRAFETSIIDWDMRETRTELAPTPPGAWDSGSPIPIAFGNLQAWVQFIQRVTNSVPFQIEIKSNPINAIKRILSLQSQLTPDDVGPPLTTAYLDRAGLHFIEAGVCGR